MAGEMLSDGADSIQTAKMAVLKRTEINIELNMSAYVRYPGYSDLTNFEQIVAGVEA